MEDEGREQKSMITLTKEIIENAKDYMPIERKHIWCRNVSTACVAAVTMKSEGDASILLPDRYEENTMARTMAMASVLAQNYLGIYGEDAVLQAADYDEIMGSHLVNQLERMKSDKDVRDKIFNILYDLGELRKMLNTEIYSRLGHLNDTLARALVALQGVNPEGMEDVANQAKELSAIVNDYQKKKAGRVAGDVAKASRRKKKAEEDAPTKEENAEQ